MSLTEQNPGLDALAATFGARRGDATLAGADAVRAVLADDAVAHGWLGAGFDGRERRASQREVGSPLPASPRSRAVRPGRRSRPFAFPRLPRVSAQYKTDRSACPTAACHPDRRRISGARAPARGPWASQRIVSPGGSDRGPSRCSCSAAVPSRKTCHSVTTFRHQVELVSADATTPRSAVPAPWREWAFQG